MKFITVINHSAYRAILDQVCDAILNGELREGDWLPSERDIAQQSGISRTSVREALKLLNDAGITTMKTGGGGGTQIISTSIPSGLLQQVIETHRQNLLEFQETRNIIEMAAAEMAAARATPEQMEEFDVIISDMEKLLAENPSDQKAYIAIDIAFHRLVIKCANNQVLLDVYLPILKHPVWLNEAISVEKFHQYTLPTMRQFVEAVKKRDPHSAKFAIYSHIQPLGDFIQDIFKD